MTILESCIDFDPGIYVVVRPKAAEQAQDTEFIHKVTPGSNICSVSAAHVIHHYMSGGQLSMCMYSPIRASRTQYTL